MPKKLMSCYRKVKAKGTADNPMAVCIKSTGQKPHRRKKGKK
jgi:hypothetical protein